MCLYETQEKIGSKPAENRLIIHGITGSVNQMIIPIPFDINRHLMLHRTVRSRGGRGGMINLPKKYIGQKAIILLALYEDEEETEKWFNAVTKYDRG